MLRRQGLAVVGHCRLTSGLPETRAQFRRTRGSQGKAANLVIICIPLAGWYGVLKGFGASKGIAHDENPSK